MGNGTFNKPVNEADTKVNPQVKSIRLALVRTVNTITNKMVRENDPVVIGKLNGALTAISIAASILNEDFLRASRILSSARSLASISKDDKEE